MSPSDPRVGMDLWTLLGAGLVGLWTGGVLALSRLPNTPLSRALRGFAVCGALWAAGDLVASHAPDLFWKYVGLDVLYSGVIFLPPLWWILALRWAEDRGVAPGPGLRRWTRIPLVWAGAMWIAMVTNPWHGLFIVPVLGGRNVYRPLWWLMAVPSYAMILGVFALELRVRRLVRAPEARRQGAFMLAASGLTLVANWLYVAGVNLGANPTVPVLGLSGVIVAVGMVREGLFGVLPIALPVIASHDPDGVMVLRADGRLVYANSQARALLAPLVLAADRPLLSVLARRLLRGDGESCAEVERDWEQRLWPTLLRPGGTLFRYGDGRWLRVSARPVGGHRGRVLAHCLRIHDATDEQCAETERRRARRLESVAELALGVAHDFHNLLAVVRGNAELLAGQLPDRPELQRKLDKILRSGAQATELADQLQLYAGAAEPRRTPLDLSRLVRETLGALDVERGSGAAGGAVDVQLDLAQGRLVVDADATQLRQLVLNLFVNARDALGERGGAIHVETGRARLDAGSSERLVLSGGRSAGEYVHLRISDDGPGIDPETQERIFEPFFSTKGKHRGIGLATVLGIARSHDALLGLESASGRGTSFSIYFPPADGDAA